MGKLQHNKTIVVDGPKVQAVVCGSTNFTWRGFFVQSNNAMVLRARTRSAVPRRVRGLLGTTTPAGFGKTASAKWTDLGLSGDRREGRVFTALVARTRCWTRSPDIGDEDHVQPVLLAGVPVPDPGAHPRGDQEGDEQERGIFVYGISDKKVGGLDLQKPNGNVAPVLPEALTKNVPEPFKSEPTGLAGNFGNRMHHKFVVIDFDKPTARVYLGLLQLLLGGGHR